MRKILLIASREYQAAVRSKAFVVSLVIMPLMMSGGLAFQWFLQEGPDLADRQFVLIDHIDHPDLIVEIKEQLRLHNQQAIFDDAGRQIKPRLVLVEPSAQETLHHLGSDSIAGLAELCPPDPQETANGSQVALRYQPGRLSVKEFPTLVEAAATSFFRERLRVRAKLSEKALGSLVNPVSLGNPPPVRRTAAPAGENRLPPQLVPVVLMLLMFLVVMMTATPLMQGVVEEKMQRIAEVLLGSVHPFELMMGKLLGTTAVSLTTAGVYLGGTFWAASHLGLAQDLSLSLVFCFVLFQALASLLFGSLFIAIGASCTDIRESQNLLWPVMLLACLPLFLMGTILREPNGSLARGMSFFPFAAPTLLVARQAVPPGVPWWELGLGVVILLATSILGVVIAGRIFRVGILMQGKGGKLSEMLTWVFRG